MSISALPLVVSPTPLLSNLIVGVALGRWSWSLFADQVGGVSHPVTGLLPVLLTIPFAILIANLIAAVPGRIAARTQPTTVLRSE